MTTRILSVVFIVAFGAAAWFILAEPSSGVVPVPVAAPPSDSGADGVERHCLSRVFGYPCPEPASSAMSGGDMPP